jgi:hypothetical protein
MPTNASPKAEAYRERAKLCIRLADVTDDLWTKDALRRCCAEMLQIAQDLEATEPTPRFYVAG